MYSNLFDPFSFWLFVLRLYLKTVSPERGRSRWGEPGIGTGRDATRLQPPSERVALQDCGFVRRASAATLPTEIRPLFDEACIPVTGIRHVRQAIRVAAERKLPERGRTAVADEEFWRVMLRAMDGATHEANASLVGAAPG